MRFFPCLYHGIIFYSAELFDCAVNFKFYLNIFIFLNINTNIKGAIFELRSSNLFRNQPYKEHLEVKGKTCFFTDVWFFTDIFEDFGHIFPFCSCRTSHNLISNKFVIFKNKKLTKILEVRKFSSNVTSLSTLFRKWHNFRSQS